MKCPKCGFLQPATDECIQCGVFVERYRPETLRPKVPAPEELEKTAEDPALDPDPLKRPIRPSLRIARSGAGVVGLALGSWLFLAGQQLELRPAHVLFLIAYACVSLFWVLTAFVRVPVRQFAVEMLVFIVATLGLRVALPEAFSLGTLSNQLSGPYIADEGEALPRPEDFHEQIGQLADKARSVLQTPTDKALSAEWLTACKELKVAYRALPADARNRIEKSYKGLVALETRLEAVRSSGEPDRVLVEAAFRAVEDLEKLVLAPTPGPATP